MNNRAIVTKIEKSIDYTQCEKYVLLRSCSEEGLIYLLNEFDKATNQTYEIAGQMISRFFYDEILMKLKDK